MRLSAVIGGSVLESGHEVERASWQLEELDLSALPEEARVDVKEVHAAREAGYFPVELGPLVTSQLLKKLLSTGLPSNRAIVYDYLWQEKYSEAADPARRQVSTPA